MRIPRKKTTADRTTADAVGCPDEDTLILMSAGSDVPPGVALHATSCERCRQALQRIREHEALLGELARSLEPSPTPRVPEPPPALPGYEVLMEVGRGGQGTVYLARQDQTKRTVALKVLNDGGRASIRSRHRFEREVEIAAGLQHPNIVTVFEAQSLADGRLVLVMEYVPGVTAEVWSRGLPRADQEDPLRTRQIRMLVRTARAVGHAHRRGIIHRDLKPSNILVDDDEQPHILDFGLARRHLSQASQALHADPDDPPQPVSLLASVAGVFQGTLAYAAPEQLAADHASVDVRSDIYSLGAMAYELCTGVLPLPTGGTTSEYLARTSGSPPPPSPSLAAVAHGSPALHPDVDAVLLKALAADRKARYQTAEEFADDLEAILLGRGVEARSRERWYRWRHAIRRNRVPLAALSLLVLILTAAAAVFGLQSRALSRQADSLTAALTRSSVEKARAMMRAGHIAQAESILWPEFLRAHARQPEQDGEHVPFRGSPEYLRSYWALWELLADNPCRAMLILPDLDAISVFEDTITTFEVPIATRRLSIPDLEARGPFIQRSLPEDIDPEEYQVRISGFDSLLMVTRAESLDLLDVVSGEHFRRIDLPGPHVTAASVDRTRLFILAGGTDVYAAPIESPAPPDRLIQGLRGLVDGGYWMSNTIFAAGADALVQREPDGSITHWDLNTRRSTRFEAAPGGTLAEIKDWAGTLPIAIESAAQSPDGRRLAMVISRFVVLADLENPTADLRRFDGSPGAAKNALRFSPDGSMLVCGGPSHSTTVWSAATGRILHRFRGHESNVSPAFFSSDGRWIVNSSGKTIRVWDLRAKDSWGNTPPGASPRSVLDARFDHSGTRLAAVSDDGTLILWRMTAGPDGHAVFHDPPQTIRVCQDVVSSTDFSPDGSRIVTAAYDGIVRIFDAESLERIREFEPVNSKIWCVRFAPDGRRVAWSDFFGSLTLARVDDGSLQHIPLHPSTGDLVRAPGIVFSGSGSHVFASVVVNKSPMFSVACFRLADGREVWRTPFDYTVRGIAISPDGGSLAVTCDDGIISLLDTADGRRITALRGIGTRAFGVAFHPLGRLLFSTHMSGVFGVWDVQSGESIASFPAHDGAVFTVAISPDGKTLATGGESTTGLAQTWPGQSPDEQPAADSATLRSWNLTAFRDHLAATRRYWSKSVSVGSPPIQHEPDLSPLRGADR